MKLVNAQNEMLPSSLICSKHRTANSLTLLSAFLLSKSSRASTAEIGGQLASNLTNQQKKLESLLMHNLNTESIVVGNRKEQLWKRLEINNIRFYILLLVLSSSTPFLATMTFYQLHLMYRGDLC